MRAKLSPIFHSGYGIKIFKVKSLFKIQVKITSLISLLSKVLSYVKVSKWMNNMRGLAKSLYDNYLDIFAEHLFNLYFFDLKEFFDGIQKLLSKEMSPSMIKYNSNFNKQIIAKKTKHYKLKHIKKLLNKTIETIERCFSEENKSLVLFVVQKVENTHLNHFKEYQKLISECYEGENVGFDSDEVKLKELWREIQSAMKN